MKTISSLLLSLIAFATSAFAESRSIVVWLDRPEQGPSTATVYSDEKKENNKNIDLPTAAAILKQAQGWGSAVSVFILSDRSIETRDYIILLEGMKENGWLQLTSIEVSHDRSSFSGTASHLLKHFVKDYETISKP
jgi:hypothetical protein